MTETRSREAIKIAPNSILRRFCADVDKFPKTSQPTIQFGKMQCRCRAMLFFDHVQGDSKPGFIPLRCHACTAKLMHPSRRIMSLSTKNGSKKSSCLTKKSPVIFQFLILCAGRTFPIQTFQTRPTESQQYARTPSTPLTDDRNEPLRRRRADFNGHAI